MTFCHQGPFFESHWTLDSCLRKSRGEAAVHVTTYVRASFRRMNDKRVARPDERIAWLVRKTHPRGDPGGAPPLRTLRAARRHA